MGQYRPVKTFFARNTEQSIEIYYTHFFRSLSPSLPRSLRALAGGILLANHVLRNGKIQIRMKMPTICVCVFGNSAHTKRAYRIVCCALLCGCSLLKKNFISTENQLRLKPCYRSRSAETRLAKKRQRKKKHIIGLGFDVLSQSGEMRNDPFRYLF